MKVITFHCLGAKGNKVEWKMVPTTWENWWESGSLHPPYGITFPSKFL